MRLKSDYVVKGGSKSFCRLHIRSKDKDTVVPQGNSVRNQFCQFFAHVHNSFLIQHNCESNITEKNDNEKGR